MHVTKRTKVGRIVASSPLKSIGLDVVRKPPPRWLWSLLFVPHWASSIVTMGAFNNAARHYPANRSSATLSPSNVILPIAPLFDVADQPRPVKMHFPLCCSTLDPLSATLNATPVLYHTHFVLSWIIPIKPSRRRHLFQYFPPKLSKELCLSVEPVNADRSRYRPPLRFYR